ncbi:YciI family protein [Bradyrhizobium sp. URHC0002]
MRFMYIVTSPQSDKGPTPALAEAMGKLADREIKAGRMLDMGGLMPIAMAGAQVRITNSKLGVIDGPFVETKELIGGYAIFELRDMEEAVAAAREFMQLHLEHMPGWEGTCEVRMLATPGVDGACEVDVHAHA